MSVFHTNIRSYKKNFEELRAIITFPNRFDIIGLSETWDSNTRPINYQPIEGYHTIERIQGSTQNAGVAMYITDALAYKVREDLSIAKSGMNNEFECLFIELAKNLQSESYIVGVLYRHPKSKVNLFIKDLNDIFSKIKNENKKLILMGDFNINLLNTVNHRNEEKFLDFMLDNFLFPYISQPTRFENQENPSLIDNIFFNDISAECISGNLISHISDHLPNFLIIPNPKKAKAKTKLLKRDF